MHQASLPSKNRSGNDTTRTRFDPAAPALLAAATLFSAWQFWSLRNKFEFGDESDNISAGWLIGRGFRLYDSLFEHHLPLAYIVAHLSDVVYPPESLAKFRIAMWSLYLVAAVSFLLSPLRASLTIRSIAAALFLVLTTLLAPAWWGEMLLVENMWACGVIVFLNLFLLPKILSPEVRISPALLIASGAATGWWVSGSLVTLFPLLVVVAIIAALMLQRKVSSAELRLVLAGVLLVALLELGWLMAFGSVRGFIEQGIEFNLRVYNTFLADMLGYQSTSVLAVLRDALLTGARSARNFRESGIETISAVFLILVVPLLVISLRQRWSWRHTIGLVAGMAILILTLKGRRSEFHGAPYYLTVVCMLSWLLTDTARLSRRSFVFTVGVGVACIAAAAFIGQRAFVFRSSLGDHSGRNSRLDATIQYVREHTSPDERVAALPWLPIFYYRTQRPPAHGGVFYLPWNAAWEERFGKRNTCAELSASQPRFILLERRQVWGHAFADYARCIDQLVISDYQPLNKSLYPNLYVRNDR